MTDTVLTPERVAELRDLGPDALMPDELSALLDTYTAHQRRENIMLDRLNASEIAHQQLKAQIEAAPVAVCDWFLTTWLLSSKFRGKRVRLLREPADNTREEQ